MVLGFDPAFRTGAKLAVVDQTGKLITTQVIYPVAPASQAKIAQAKKDLADLIKEHAIEILLSEMEQPAVKVKPLWQKSSKISQRPLMSLSMKVVPQSTLLQSWPVMSSQT